MSTLSLTQVLLANTLRVIFIYYFKRNFPSFYGRSFEGLGREKVPDQQITQQYILKNIKLISNQVLINPMGNINGYSLAF